MNRIVTTLIAFLAITSTAVPAHAQFRFLDVVVDPTANVFEVFEREQHNNIVLTSFDQYFKNMTALANDGHAETFRDGRNIDTYTFVIVPHGTMTVVRYYPSNVGVENSREYFVQTTTERKVSVNVDGRIRTVNAGVWLLYSCEGSDDFCRSNLEHLLATKDVMIQSKGVQNFLPGTPFPERPQFTFWMNQDGQFIF